LAAKDGAENPLNAILASETLGNVLNVHSGTVTNVEYRQKSIKQWLEEALSYMPEDTLVLPKTL